MSAGTIALTNGSSTVGGTGTTFTSELKAGDFIGVTVGGAPYTMIVASIASNTQLTIAQAYNGPTASGLGWYGVPATLKYAITQQVLNDMATNQRGMIAQLANWQQIYSDAASVTVERPDRSTFTGPSWGYINAQYANKANKGANSDITSLSGLTTALSVAQGGTGAKDKAGAWAAIATYGNTAGTAVQGNDPRLTTINGMTGGVVTGDLTLDGNNINIRSTSPGGGWPSFITFMAGAGNNLPYAKIYQQSNGRLTFAVDLSGTVKYIHMTVDGGMSIPGNVTCASLTQTSDINKKEDIVEITDALASIDELKGYTYKLKDGGKASAGIIAQEWQRVLPSIVSEVNQEDVVYDEEGLPTGEVIKSSSLSVDYSGVCAFLLSALRELKLKHDNMKTELDDVKTRLNALDGLES